MIIREFSGGVGGMADSIDVSIADGSPRSDLDRHVEQRKRFGWVVVTDEGFRVVLVRRKP